MGIYTHTLHHNSESGAAAFLIVPKTVLIPPDDAPEEDIEPIMVDDMPPVEEEDTQSEHEWAEPSDTIDYTPVDFGPLEQDLHRRRVADVKAERKSHRVGSATKDTAD
eukprot:1892740-Rhodomonas_salina.1